MGEKELAEAVRRLFHYDVETGHLTNAVQRANSAKVGQRAGCLKHDGYRHIQIFGERYMEHRVVWLWVHGRWPHPEIDHINRSRDDNRIANLREVTRSENMRNTVRKSSAPRPYVRARGKRFYAYANVGKRQIHLGAFSSAEAARAAHIGFASQQEAA